MVLPLVAATTHAAAASLSAATHRLVADTSTTLPSFTGACADDPSAVCTTVRDWTGSDAWASAAEWLVARPLTIALIVLVAWIANRIAHVAIKRSMTRLLDPDRQRARRMLRAATPAVLQSTGEVGMRADARAQTLTTVFRSLATILIWFVAIVWILSVLDVDVAPLVASAGILGVALGFGAQNVVRDFLAGTFMVIEDQFGVGDVVDLGEATGTVEGITLRATRVRDVQGTLWHVPNGQIQRVANKSQSWSRAVLDLDVDGATDYEAAAPVIAQVANAVAADPDYLADIVDSPELWGIEAFTADGYTIRLVVKTRPAAQFRVMRELRARIRVAFAEHGLVLAGSRNDVWVHDADGGAGPIDLPTPDEG